MAPHVHWIWKPPDFDTMTDVVVVAGPLSGKTSVTAGLRAWGLPVWMPDCLRDERLNEALFDTLDDARLKLALWRYDYHNVRPHSSLRNKTPAEARQTLYLGQGFAPEALAQTETNDDQPCRLSL